MSVGQPIELSDALVAEARLMGEATGRSVADQIELWVRLGRIVDSCLGSSNILALKKLGGVKSLAECLAEVETPEGQQRTREILDAQPFPHFEDAHGHPGLLVRIDENGTRTVGHFVDRTFVAETPGSLES